MTEIQNFTPDWVSPPGGTIEDLIEERGWTQVELAERLDFTPKHVNDLIRGSVPLSPEAAGRLSRVLGSTPTFWMVREAQYRAVLQKREAIADASTDAAWLEELPLAWMRKQGWVSPVREKGQQVLEALEFFGVASVGAWRVRYERPLIAFRASTKFEMKLGAVATWLRRAELDASEISCQPFDKASFRRELTALRSLTTEADPQVFIPETIERCTANGVAVVFVPAPPGCPASGATRWLSPDKAMLVLSLRHKSNDHLWFTFFHEAAHLLRHGKKMLFVDGLDGLDDRLEEEADRFARRLLIPPSAARKLAALGRRGAVSKTEVLAFASEVGVAPGVVVGRMQKEGWLPWSHLNGLKIRYDWK